MAAVIKLTDTLTGKKQTFKPREANKVRMYGCGPTVYGFVHVGNARAFLVQDLVNRTLRHAGYEVEFARNYTDVDDKIIGVANRENISSDEVARRYSKAFDEDMDVLGVLCPDRRPRATETIPEMISMIEGLQKKGLAYPAKASEKSSEGRDVYFRVEKFKKYGCLSKRKLEDMIEGVRIEPGETKEHPGDFALWKAAKPGEPSWDSPWGKGRPGWHIECSAMIHEIFGENLDIHLGGIDLIFPHHENEIAQSEGFSEKTLANYWLHNGMLEIGKEKMSKSLGNILSTREFFNLYGPETLRLLVFQHHYRHPMDFSDESILRAEALLDRLYLCKKQTIGTEKISPPVELPAELTNLQARMEEAFFDDFNSAKALGFVLAAARVCFRENRPELWKAWSVCLQPLQSILGLLKGEPAHALEESKQRRLKRMGITPERAQEIDALLVKREMLRAAKNFVEADNARKSMEEQGIIVMDGPDGSSWRLK